MNFLTVSVLLSFLSCITYTVVAILLECRGITLSDTLTQYFFMLFGIEFGATAAIKIAKYTIKKKEIKDTVERLVENNLPVGKNDLSVDDNDEYVDDNTYYG